MSVTKEQLDDWFNQLMLAVVKARSDIREFLESFDHDYDWMTDWMAEDMHPWLFGEKSILPHLQACVDGEKSVSLSALMNFMYIVEHWEPSIGIVLVARECDVPSVEEIMNLMKERV